MAISPITFRAYAPGPVYSGGTGSSRRIQQPQTVRHTAEKSAGKQTRIAQLEAKIEELTNKLNLDEENLSPEEQTAIVAEIEDAKAELEEIKHLNILA